jgi:hypothetical protein
MSNFQFNLKITFNDKKLNRVTLYVHVTRYMCTTRSQFNNCRILTVHQFTTNAQNNLHPNQYTYRPVQTSQGGCKWHDGIRSEVNMLSRYTSKIKCSWAYIAIGISTYFGVRKITPEICPSTRWFKYDWDDLCVNKSQFVPVIFEPPCILDAPCVGAVEVSSIHS